MVKEYLNELKTAGNFSWNDLSKLSGLPDATIRKIFSGETADPRLETVVRLVTAMGGSMDELVGGSKKEEAETNGILPIEAFYEARIAEIKASSAELVNSLRRDKRHLWVAVCILAIFLILFLMIDVLADNMGWIRY